MILARGTIPTTQGTIFEVNWQRFLSKTPSAKLEKITFFNTNAAAQTAILYLQPRAGTAAEIRQFVLQQNEGGEFLEPGEFMSLDSGDQLQAETTTASAVNFAVIGERVGRP